MAFQVSFICFLKTIFIAFYLDLIFSVLNLGMADIFGLREWKGSRNNFN